MTVPTDLVFRKSIPLSRGRGDLVVRGLNLEDITLLLQTHLGAITAAVDNYRQAQSDVFSRQGMDSFLLSMAGAFPALTAEVIAAAADDRAAVERVRQMGTGLQIKALLSIAELTLEDMGDLSDPSPALAALLRRGMQGLMTPTQSSDDSTGVSDVS